MGVLSVQDKDMWMSFLPKTTQKRTLTEGVEMYASHEKYAAYKKEFDEYVRSSAEYFEDQLQKEIFSGEEIREFFGMAARHFSYYSKTEFFYTDGIDSTKMVPSVQEFDALKLGGRAYLNKILFAEYVPNFVDKLSEQYSVPKEELFKYSVAEIVSLSDGKSVPEREIEERAVVFASLRETLFGKEAYERVKDFLAPYRERSDVIKGSVAYKGVVRGKARVLAPDFSDFSKIAAAVEEMQQGEILVAETTAPEIVAACKKAAAIITNQGGILSHAAIIARELKIPCIIGTDKNVVLNIKTGDELLVDADNGIIKIIR
ncbi:MAG: PEP-utilizing enzyme [Patescibacteria group bacterium]